MPRMKATTHARFIVSITLPENTNMRDMQTYIRDAVGGWCGGLNAQEDPLFNINSDTVRVQLLEKQVKYA